MKQIEYQDMTNEVEIKKRDKAALMYVRAPKCVVSVLVIAQIGKIITVKRNFYNFSVKPLLKTLKFILDKSCVSSLKDLSEI